MGEVAVGVEPRAWRRGASDADPRAEQERIRDVYRSYAEDPAYTRRHAGHNAGNEVIARERRLAMRGLLEKSGLLPLTTRRVLDVGCGGGDELDRLREWGGRPENLLGLDLLPERIRAAQAKYPEIRFICGDAQALEYDDGSFDLVLLFTVISSILSNRALARVCAEVARVVKSGGGVLCYDLRFRNPYNPRVRAVSMRDLRAHFVGFRMETYTLTVLPPLARRLGLLTEQLYPMLANVPLFRTHRLCMLTKP